VAHLDLGFDPCATISAHSTALADAASRDLDAQVPSCPGWDVAALVQHVIEVQWFWASIVELHLTDRTQLPSRPEPAARDQLVDVLRAGAAHMTDVLRAADQDAHVYTWAPDAQTVGFITRHQVQEAAVHHWDAANAVGAPFAMDVIVAADAVDEFLTYSLSSTHWPADEGTAPLGSSLVLKSLDTGDAWMVTDGHEPRTLTMSRVTADSTGEDAAVVEASAVDLLLWLYRRVALEPTAGDAQLLTRFRAYSSTD